MAQAVAEVPEAGADAKIKGIYDDIKQTFRVPIVNLVFRVLATHPDYLQIAWRNLKPNAQTLYFEERADELRALAASVAAGFGQAPSPAPRDEVAPVLRVFHYVNPKLLLAVGALRSATYGLQPKLMELPSDAKRQFSSGIPEGLTEINMVDPDTPDEHLAAIFADIKSTLGLSLINSDYRALACWPDYLDSAWAALKPIVARPEYRQLQRDLRARTEEAVAAFPFRMDLYPHALRHSGLSEADIDAVQSTLDRFYRLLPGLVANIAFLTIGVDGNAGAARSPFPVSVR